MWGGSDNQQHPIQTVCVVIWISITHERALIVQLSFDIKVSKPSALLI
jgi:hypothetical protein